MSRTIDYGEYLDQECFERQLTKELEQVASWIHSVTDMDRAEAAAAMRQALQDL